MRIERSVLPSRKASAPKSLELDRIGSSSSQRWASPRAASGSNEDCTAHQSSAGLTGDPFHRPPACDEATAGSTVAKKLFSPMAALPAVAGLRLLWTWIAVRPIVTRSISSRMSACDAALPKESLPTAPATSASSTAAGTRTIDPALLLSPCKAASEDVVTPRWSLPRPGCSSIRLPHVVQRAFPQEKPRTPGAFSSL